jgi:hypothetical protein
MIPIEIIGFLRQLSPGQLEIIYENLSHKREYPTIPLPTKLASKDDLILLICTIPRLDLLSELLSNQSVDDKALYSQLHNLYKRTSQSDTPHQVLDRLLRTNQSYAERIDLSIEHSTSIGWTEEPFERLVGVYSKYPMGFIIDLEEYPHSDESTLSVRVSDPLDLQHIETFAHLVYAKYPKQFTEEYCDQAYNSIHYEHPILSLFEGYIPLIQQEYSKWTDTLDNLCSPELPLREDGIAQLRDLMMSTPSLCRYLSQLFEVCSPNTLVQYPLFEHNLLSRHSILSSLWIFAYLQIDLPKNLEFDRPLTTKEYLKLITPLREMFVPLIIEAKESIDIREAG